MTQIFLWGTARNAYSCNGPSVSSNKQISRIARGDQLPTAVAASSGYSQMMHRDTARVSTLALVAIVSRLGVASATSYPTEFPTEYPTTYPSMDGHNVITTEDAEVVVSTAVHHYLELDFARVRGRVCAHTAPRSPL